MDAQALHIWLADEASAFSRLREAALITLLSPQEYTHCQGFHQPDDRQRALLTRQMIRQLLSHYHPAIPPQAWTFRPGPQGKPAVSNALQPPLYFSISHCKGYVAIAFCRQPLVGIDIEHHQRLEDVRNVMAVAFNADEEDFVLAAGEAQQRARFYAIWTLKEAWLKATGDGLTQPLRALNVAIGEQGLCHVEAAPCVTPPRFAPHCQQWQIAADWTLSLVVNLPQPAIRFYRWQEEDQALPRPAPLG